MENIQAQNLSDAVLLSEISARIEKYRAAVENLNSLNKQLLELNQKLTESEAMKSHLSPTSQTRLSIRLPRFSDSQKVSSSVRSQTLQE